MSNATRAVYGRFGADRERGIEPILHGLTGPKERKRSDTP